MKNKAPNIILAVNRKEKCILKTSIEKRKIKVQTESY